MSFPITLSSYKIDTRCINCYSFACENLLSIYLRLSLWFTCYVLTKLSHYHNAFNMNMTSDCEISMLDCTLEQICFIFVYGMCAKFLACSWQANAKGILGARSLSCAQSSSASGCMLPSSQIGIFKGLGQILISEHIPFKSQNSLL